MSMLMGKDNKLNRKIILLLLLRVCARPLDENDDINDMKCPYKTGEKICNRIFTVKSLDPFGQNFDSKIKSDHLKKNHKTAVYMSQ